MSRRASASRSRLRYGGDPIRLHVDGHRSAFDLSIGINGAGGGPVGVGPRSIGAVQAEVNAAKSPEGDPKMSVSFLHHRDGAHLREPRLGTLTGSLARCRCKLQV